MSWVCGFGVKVWGMSRACGVYGAGCVCRVSLSLCGVCGVCGSKFTVHQRRGPSDHQVETCVQYPISRAPVRCSVLVLNCNATRATRAAPPKRAFSLAVRPLRAGGMRRLAACFLLALLSLSPLPRLPTSPLSLRVCM
jgi:hypothetical protein